MSHCRAFLLVIVSLATLVIAALDAAISCP